MIKNRNYIIGVVSIINILLLILTFSLFFCKDTSTTKTGIDVKNSDEITSISNSRNNKDTRDYFYKMFYGKWEITEIISVDPRFGVSEASKRLIGQTIEYSFDNIKINEKVELENPIFYTALVPTEPDFTLIENLPSVGMLGIEGDYFAYVHIGNWFDGDKPFIGTNFFVKDDSTLILIEYNTYFEMKRMTRIENPIIALPG